MLYIPGHNVAILFLCHDKHEAEYLLDLPLGDLGSDPWYMVTKKDLACETKRQTLRKRNVNNPLVITCVVSKSVSEIL